MTAAQLHLITGGARSGKSRFAHELALNLGSRRLFVATAQAFDDEMRARIELHRIERGSAYDALEAPTEVAAALAACDRYDVILIDCLTLWVSNLLLQELSDADIRRSVMEGIVQARARASHVIVVSNEVGFGIVPENALARRFRDVNGWMQQDLAAESATLYLALMGRVLPLHELAFRPSGGGGG